MTANRFLLTVLLVLALLAPGAVALGAPDPNRGLAQQTALAAASACSLPDSIRVRAVDLQRAAQVTAGSHHTCAVTVGGAVMCWGGNHYGQIGDGTRSDRWTPANVTGLSSGVVAVAADYGHTCAVTESGGVKCWGWNYYGQLGDGTTTDRWTPVDVTGLSSGVAAIASCSGHTCALTVDGGIKCWGSNNRGQLGDGTTTNRSTPVNVIGLNSGVVAVAAGSQHTCAMTAGGKVKCWGANWCGELGDGTTTGRWTPVDVVFTQGYLPLIMQQ